MKTCIHAVVAFAVVLPVCISRLAAAVEASPDAVTIDGVKIPLDAEIDLVGPAEEVNYRMLGHGLAALRADRIGGRASQDELLVNLHPSLSQTFDGPVAKALKAMKPGSWYRIRGRLTDANPQAARPSLAVAVERVDQIEPIPPAPLVLADVSDRPVRLEGTATAGGTFRAGGETAVIVGVADWPADVLGKLIAVRGVVRAGSAAGTWRIEKPVWSLVELADQIGKSITLDGHIWSLNGHWWVEYRGERLYVTDVADHTITMPSQNHGRRARVSGLLVRQLRPSLAQISLKVDRDLVQHYVLRRATIEYLNDPMPGWVRFRSLNRRPPRVSDGVPELVAEQPPQRNIMGDETRARPYQWRNEETIATVLRDLTPQSREVLVKRMNDAGLSAPIRLLYAAMLAAANNDVGRAFLAAAVRRPETPDFHDALYCLGSSAFLMPEDAKIKTDLAWAEPVMVELMTHKDADQKLDWAILATTYSDIPACLLKLNTPAARKVLVDFATAGTGLSSSVLTMMCRSETLLPIQDLDRLERAATEDHVRRAVLSQYLRHKHPDAVVRFVKDMGKSFFYSDYREHLSPEVAASLQANLSKFAPAAREDARMLILLAGNDPVPEIIRLLDDPLWQDKNGVFYELTARKDPRSIEAVARFLRDAPTDGMRSDSEMTRTLAVEHALAAIAAPDARQSVSELIALFDVDLSRFGTYIDRDGLRRLIAAHLIELTGESFGTDAPAWRKWAESQR